MIKVIEGTFLGILPFSVICDLSWCSLIFVISFIEIYVSCPHPKEKGKKNTSNTDIQNSIGGYIEYNETLENILGFYSFQGHIEVIPMGTIYAGYKK